MILASPKSISFGIAVSELSVIMIFSSFKSL
jgi:hypothetical protein